MSDHYHYGIELMPNNLIRVFSYASKLSACYNSDGTYRHGDLRKPTLAELLGYEPAEVTLLEDTKEHQPCNETLAKLVRAWQQNNVSEVQPTDPRCRRSKKP